MGVTGMRAQMNDNEHEQVASVAWLRVGALWEE
jgi:hypothetical protein